MRPFESFFHGRRVLVTGHTGFKGTWLCLWLRSIGAEVSGFALSPDSGRPSLFELVNLATAIRSDIGDVRDADSVARCIKSFKPQTIFHLAAQPLVRRSYNEPAETFAVNVLGTVNVLEAARRARFAGQVVAITTDKVYQNERPGNAFRETDPLGGHDPYSASKACAEIVAASYARSYPQIPVATARAGNVIGGGDWSEDRLVPDCVRALERSTPLAIRNPNSIRPWQLVLEPLAGYMALAAALEKDPARFSGPWNFGPSEGEDLTVSEIVEELLNAWGRPNHPVVTGAPGPYEAAQLRLDSTKARTELNWRPRYSSRQALRETAGWYKAVAGGSSARDECLRSIQAYATAGAAHG